jgi:predicted GTPase
LNVQKKHNHAGKQIFEDGNAWDAFSKILAAMLEDSTSEIVILIVDAFDECTNNLHQLLDFIAKPYRVNWIVFSRNLPLVEEKLGKVKQKVGLQLELNENSILLPSARTYGIRWMN